MTLIASQYFSDCYKVIIETLLDYSNFTNKKILDQCVDSNDEDVTIYEYNPITTQSDSFWLGSGAKGGSTCFSNWPSFMVQFVFAVINVIIENSS